MARTISRDRRYDAGADASQSDLIPGSCSSIKDEGAISCRRATGVAAFIADSCSDLWRGDVGIECKWRRRGTVVSICIAGYGREAVCTR